MNISNEGINITNRFFIAIDALKQYKLMKSVRAFTLAHNINYWNFNTVKKNPDKSILKPEWIYYLCNDYGVSSDYIILGKGFIFNDGAFNISENKK